MEDKLIEWVYLTVLGQVSGENALPGVENAFASGSLCERKYDEMYDLLTERLDPEVLEDDRIICGILNDMDAIQRDLCYRMFRLGMRLALNSLKS